MPDVRDVIVRDLVDRTVSEITGARSLEWITVKIDSALSVLRDRALNDEDLMLLARSFLGALPRDIFYGWLLSVDLEKLSRDPRFRGGIGSFRQLLEELKMEAEASGYKPLRLGWEPPKETSRPIRHWAGEASRVEGGWGRKTAVALLALLAAASAALIIWLFWLRPLLNH